MLKLSILWIVFALPALSGCNCPAAPTLEDNPQSEPIYKHESTADPVASSQASSQEAIALRHYEKTLPAYFQEATRVEIVVVRLTDDDIWQRIGPVIIESENDLTAIKSAAATFSKVGINDHPFAERGDGTYIEMEWLITKPARRGGLKMRSFTTKNFICDIRQIVSVEYNNSQLYNTIMDIIQNRINEKTADVLEAPL